MLELIAWLGIVLVVGFGAYLSPLGLRLLQVSRLRRECEAKRALILTYDDGPSGGLTPRVLDVLGEYGAQATFFLLGWRAEAHPEVVERAVSAGHEIGCHGQRHLNALRVTPWRAILDIAAGYQSLKRWVKPDALFRPPNGKITLATWWALKWRRARLGWWTIDTHDATAVDVTRPDCRTVIERVRASGGGVVLLHDYGGESSVRSERHDFVVTVTRQLLELAQRDRLTVLTLGRFLADMGK